VWVKHLRLWHAFFVHQNKKAAQQRLFSTVQFKHPIFL
jgi:hypothetical protein